MPGARAGTGALLRAIWLGGGIFDPGKTADFGWRCYGTERITWDKMPLGTAVASNAQLVPSSQRERDASNWK